MRERSVPAMTVVPTEANLSDLVVDNAIKAPHRVQFRRQADGRWEDVTCRDFLSEVTALAKGVVASGVQPGDRVAIMSRTRYEWTLADFALWTAGAVPVPIYETSSAEQVRVDPQRRRGGRLLRRARSPRRGCRLRTPALPGLAHVWSFGGDALEAAGRRRARGPGRGHRRPAPDATFRQPRHIDLHVRHHRPAQGLRAHPRQLPVRRRQRRRRARWRLWAGSIDPALPAARARLRPSDRDRLRELGRDHGPHRRGQEPARRPGRLPADVPALGPPGVREDLQRRPGQGERRRQGQDLRPRRRRRDRLQRGARPGRARPRAARPARAVRPARLQQAAGAHGRPRRVRGVGRCSARRSPRPLLPRRRPHDPRGLRPHRDGCGLDGQPARRDQDRHGRPAHPWLHRTHR